MGFDIQDGVLLKYYEDDKKEVIIPYGVIKIASKAFKQSSITKVYVPDSVKYIERKAFINCNNLKKISVPFEVSGIVTHCGGGFVDIIKRDKKNSAQPESKDTDYKKLFLELAYMKEPHEKENVLDMIFDDDVKIPFAVHLFVCYESPKARQYITENSNQVMHYLIDKGDLDSLDTVLQMIKSK